MLDASWLARPEIAGLVALVMLVTLVALAALAVHRLLRLSRRQKKRLVKQRARRLWHWLERRGVVERNPALIRDYHRLYPELALLERHFEVIRKECLELMVEPARIPHIQQSGGRYTLGGIHEGEWRTFMLKAGRFLEANCARAPETARLLRQLPRVETAFFSILGPRQHLRAHWGYYKGFLRYHLGLVVPNDGEAGRCWLRVTDDPAANAHRLKSAIEEAPRYVWQEGEGIVFDDTYLHDAANETDAPRAVLFLDLLRPLPWPLHLANLAFVRLARLDPALRSIHRDAVMR